GDCFGEIVERLPLNANKGIVATLQIEPFGHIVEQIDHSALRIGSSDDAHGSPVRKMPHVLFRLDRTISFVQRSFPLAEVLLVRNLARGAQTVEYGRIGWPVIEEFNVEIPERAIGRLVKAQSLMRPEYGHP